MISIVFVCNFRHEYYYHDQNITPIQKLLIYYH